MAQLALIGCGRVILRLASSGNAVVAVPATAQYLCVIHVPNRRPARRAVTVLALGGGTNVIGRRRRGLYQAAAIVARGTFTGRALEDAFDVADFAIHILMSPLERPGSGEVIKPRTESRLSVRWSQAQGQKYQPRGEEQPAQSFLAGEVRVLLH